MNTKPIRFIRRGEPVSLGNVPPDRTLLEVLREDLGCTGTKEGCGEGDCGACTVVLGEARWPRMRYRAINSCIRLAHSVDGMALWTVEDIAAADGNLHPAQEAMVQCHGSQVRLLHARLCDEPVWHVPEPCLPGPDHHPRTGAGRPVGQPVPLHRLPAHPGRRAADGRLPPVRWTKPICYKN
jgi:hypothetical protein